MKRVLIFSVSYIIFAFFLCIGINFRLDIPPLLPDSVIAYRFLSGIKTFLDLLPSLCISAALLGATMEFSRYSKYCVVPFSEKIFVIYSYVMKLGLLIVFILTLSAELLLPLVSAKRELMKSNYTLYQDYMKWGEYYLSKGDYALALHYAQNVATLNAKSKEAESFIGRAEAEAEAAEHKKDFSIGSDGDKKLFEEERAEKAKALSFEELKARSNEAAAKGDWFAAHYYAKLANDLSDSTADTAWKNLSIPQVSIRNEVYEGIYDVYNTKYAAYSALQNDDPKTAYYILKKLYDTSRSLADDPDIRQYLAKAEKALLKKYFFLDEVEGIEHFEDSRNVYFCIKSEKETYVVFVQGEASFKEGMYLRGLSLDVFDEFGDLLYSMNVPYAKILTDYSSNESLQIIVKSVYKDSDMGVTEPIFTYPDGHTEIKDDLFYELPLSFEDFTIVSNASIGADKMYLTELMKFIRKSERYGFSTESARLVLVERLCHPILMLIIIVFAAAFAWNYRLESSRDFKLRYLLFFPFITLMCYTLIECGMYVLRLLAAVLVGVVGYYALAVSFVACIFLLTAVSLLFLSRHSQKDFA